MRSMAIEATRRAALGLLASALGFPQIALGGASEARYLSAYAAQGGFGVAVFDGRGAIRQQFALPGRGHGFAVKPDGRMAVAFSRRPGQWARAFEPHTGRVLQSIDAATDRNFCGHGAFSADGRLLFATEVIAATGEGVVGVYAADAGFRRIAEWSTLGLDPHEVLLMPDGVHLAVANGGILMRADLPRMKLNLAEMDPSLVYLDIRTGHIVRQVKPPTELRQLSIRHMAIGTRNQVLIGMQYEGPALDRVPLVAVHDGWASDAPLRFLAIPEEQQSALNQYCGSVASDRTDRYLAITSPRGSTALICDLVSGAVSVIAGAADICGVARSELAGGFTLSSGTGQLIQWQGHSEALLPRTKFQWDNHIALVGA